MNTRTAGVALVLSAACPAAVAQVGFSGTFEALANSVRETRTIATADGNDSAQATAISGNATADVDVSAVVGGSLSTLTIVHNLDSGPTPVSGAASSGAIEFVVPEGTHFELTGLLEQQSTDPAGGGSVRIRNEDTFATWFQAGPNFDLPNRPIDFSAILSGGVLDAGTYELTWFHAANNTINTGVRTVATGDFALTITPPGCVADFDGNGLLNFFDVSMFITAFVAMNPDADIDGNGLWNFFDVSMYIDLYLAGCP